MVAPGQTVSFSSSRSVDPDGRALKSRWFVDNKFISEGRRFEYAFKEPGTYTVGLEVTDDFVKPLSSVDYAKVIVNSPPVPKIEYTAIAVPNQKLRFDASKSYDVHGTIKFYSWVFSDGLMKTGKVVERSFNKSGFCTVSFNCYRQCRCCQFECPGHNIHKDQHAACYKDTGIY